MLPLLFLPLLWNFPAQAAPRLWDAVLSFGPRARAVQRLDSVVRVGDALFQGFEVDLESRDRLKDLREKLGTFDLDQVVGEKAACGAPGVGADQSRYHLTFPVNGSCKDVPGFAGVLGTPLGAWSASLRMSASQREKQRLYQLGFSGGLTIGDFSYSEIIGFWESVLRFFEVQSTEDPLAAWRAIGAQSPRFAQFIDRFFFVDSIAVKRGDVTVVDLQWRLRLNAFQKPFPALFARLNKIGRIGDTQGVVLNTLGQRVLKYRVRTDPRTVRLQFLVKEGRILPFDLEEQPIPGAPALRLLDRSDLRFQVLQTLRLDASGVRVQVDNLRWDLDVKRQGTQQSVRMAMQSYDRVEVKGNVLGFIPLAVVNAMIPQSIEASAQQSLDTSVSAFGVGRTTVVGMALESPRVTEPARLSFELGGALAENKFLQFMLRLTGSRFTPKDEEITELGRLLSQYYGALRADYLRWVAGL